MRRTRRDSTPRTRTWGASCSSSSNPPTRRAAMISDLLAWEYVSSRMGALHESLGEESGRTPIDELPDAAEPPSSGDFEAAAAAMQAALALPVEEHLGDADRYGGGGGGAPIDRLAFLIRDQGARPGESPVGG